jgi:O-antigen biosynthesis protein
MNPSMSIPDSTAVAVCVLAMHRSGSSALTRLLNLLGVDLGNDLLPATPDNPKGYWELRSIVECQRALLDELGSYFDDFLPLPQDWLSLWEIAPHRQRLLESLRTEFLGKALWGFKDPRTCRLVPLWHGLFDELGADGRFVILVRHPDEVANSLTKRGGQPYNTALLVTLAHMLDAERGSRGRRRVTVTYDQLMSDWRDVAQRVGSGLGIQWPYSPDSIALQVDQFLDAELRHHRSAGRQADADIIRWAMGAFEILSRPGRIDSAALDVIALEFNQALPRLAAWRPRGSMEDKFWDANHRIARMNIEVERLGKENQELRYQAALAEARAAASEKQAIAAQATVQDIRQSISWRITGPLRILGGRRGNSP